MQKLRLNGFWQVLELIFEPRSLGLRVHHKLVAPTETNKEEDSDFVFSREELAEARRRSQV